MLWGTAPDGWTKTDGQMDAAAGGHANRAAGKG